MADAQDLGHQWQKDMRNLHDRVAILFTRQPFSDIRFRIENRRTDEQTTDVRYFTAHKLILSASSSVFAEQLYAIRDPDPEVVVGGENDADYRITDVTHTAFETMLQYMYEQKVDFETPIVALNTYYAAKKYKVSHLQQICCTHLANVPLTPDDVIPLLEDPLYADVNGLHQRCVDIVQSKPIEVIRNAAERGQPQTLETFLQMERLAVPSELLLFQAMVEGGRIRCHRPTTPSTSNSCLQVFLKRFLKDIRFLTMNPQEFALAFEMCNGAISTEEGFAILLALSHPGSSNIRLPTWCCKITRCRISEARAVSELQILPYNSMFGDYVPGEQGRSLISSLNIKVVGGTFVFTGVALKFRRIVDEPTIDPVVFEAEMRFIPSAKYTLNLRNNAAAIAFEQVKNLRMDSNGMVLQFPIPLPVSDGQEAKVCVILENPVGLDFSRFRGTSLSSAANPPKFEIDLDNYRLNDNTFAIDKIFYIT